MRDFEFDRSSPGGGRASSGGSFYHASFRSGSRASGACAGSSYDYIAREGEYDGPELDEAVYVESGNMPSWADDDPHAFWDAADLTSVRMVVSSSVVTSHCRANSAPRIKSSSRGTSSTRWCERRTCRTRSLSTPATTPRELSATRMCT